MGVAVGPRTSPLVTYVLPLKSPEPLGGELTDYLHRLAELLPVVVIDGSDDPVFEAHHRAWSGVVRHERVSGRTLNGKVAGVLHGCAVATTPYLVIADDDVRYDAGTLQRLVRLLDEDAAVVPQNYFSPLPWHARWDSGRMLLNRAFGHDYAGTLAVRRDAVLDCGGYCGAVLFENLELLRTLTGRGHRVRHVRDLYVARRPPTARHFLGQRLRQAFDSHAQPRRQAAELAVLPVLAASWLVDRRLPLVLLGATVAAAEVGRRRDGGTAVFPPDLSWWAPAWLLERGACAWGAVLTRWRGGVRYAGQRLSRAAHPVDVLAAGGCPERSCRCETSLARGSGAAIRTA